MMTYGLEKVDMEIMANIIKYADGDRTQYSNKPFTKTKIKQGVWLVLEEYRNPKIVIKVGQSQGQNIELEAKRFIRAWALEQEPKLVPAFDE